MFRRSARVPHFLLRRGSTQPRDRAEGQADQKENPGRDPDGIDHRESPGAIRGGSQGGRRGSLDDQSGAGAHPSSVPTRVRARELSTMPHVATLTLINVRKGFLEQAEFDGVVEHPPDSLRPVHAGLLCGLAREARGDAGVVAGGSGGKGHPS